MQFDRGYISPYFVTDPARMVVELEDPFILITEKKISAMADLIPLLEQVVRTGRPILIVAEEVEGEALATLVVNKLRGTLKVAAVKAPGFGDRRKEMLKDIAVLTGGQVVAEELGKKLEQVGINDLGLQLPDESFALNLEEIAVGLRKLGAPIVILNLPDLALSPAVARLVPRLLYEKRIEMFNEHVTATAARHDLTLVDLYALSREIVPGRPELFSTDGYHPSALGYDEWARRMAPAVEQLLGVGVAATG